MGVSLIRNRHPVGPYSRKRPSYMYECWGRFQVATVLVAAKTPLHMHGAYVWIEWSSRRGLFLKTIKLIPLKRNGFGWGSFGSGSAVRFQNLKIWISRRFIFSLVTSFPSWVPLSFVRSDQRAPKALPQPSTARLKPQHSFDSPPQFEELGFRAWGSGCRAWGLRFTV